MKISENTRVARAGKAYAEAIVENVHLLYLNDNCLEYLNALIKPLKAEMERRIKNGGKHKKKAGGCPGPCDYERG